MQWKFVRGHRGAVLRDWGRNEACGGRACEPRSEDWEGISLRSGGRVFQAEALACAEFYVWNLFQHFPEKKTILGFVNGS